MKTSHLAAVLSTLSLLDASMGEALPLESGSASSRYVEVGSSGLAPFRGAAYFSAADPGGVEQLWRSDGTPEGTVKLRDFDVRGLHPPALFTETESRLFFFVDSALWDVEESGNATHVVDVPNAPAAAAEVQGLVLFPQTFDVFYTDLWTSDGTSTGTALLKPVGTGSSSTTMTRLGGYQYFWITYEGISKLWRSDGTFVGTDPTISFGTISPTSGPSPVAFGNRLGIISFGNGVGSVERPYVLWVSDGTTSIIDFFDEFAPSCPGECPAVGPTDLTDAGGRLFFIGDDGTHGRELWVSDGTHAGTRLVRDIAPGSPSGLTRGLVAVGSRVYFAATDAEHGTELWSSDGTSDGTYLVEDRVPGAGSSRPRPEFAFGERLIFTTREDGVPGPTLRVTDGTAGGTSALRALSSGGVVAAHGTLPGRTLFFESLENGDTVLWKTDGSAVGTGIVASFPGSEPSRVVEPTSSSRPDTRSIGPRP